MLSLKFCFSLPGISLRILCYIFLKLAILLCKWLLLLGLSLFSPMELWGLLLNTDPKAVRVGDIGT